MKAFRKLFSTSVLLSIALVASFSYARIGESKDDIQDRMFTKTSGAYIYPSKEERLREALEVPYKYMFLLMPEDVKQFFIFKRPNAELTTMSDTLQQHELYGWELNLSLKNNISVLEFYRRHGDPITKEEAIALFNLQKKEGAHWKKSKFIPFRKTWNVSVKEGIPEYEIKDSTKIEDILPQTNNRFVYIEIPEGVTNSTNFQQSLQSQIMEYEQRLTYAKYRNYLDKNSEQRAAKTKKAKPKKANTPAPNAGARKVIPANSYTKRFVESEIFSANNSNFTRVAYALEDVFLEESPLTSPTKEVRISVAIPTQPDTAFGYSFETSDGAVRAKLYKNSILFIDAKFDKSLREYMETLYNKQSAQRRTDAQDSVSKF